MGNCLSSAGPASAQGGAKERDVTTDVVKQQDAGAAVAVPEPLKPHASESACKAPKQQEQEEEHLDLTRPGEVPNAVVNPDTDLILNMLDPENGPAAGLPYQVHYLGPPRPPCEAERLATVEMLGKVNDALGPDPEIQCILKLVANVFKAPAALCALFDAKRVFISEQEGDVIPCGTFPWRWTLCGWSMAFKNPQVLVIQDTLQDARFRNNEKVKNPGVRFYCGAPLVASNNQRLGTLCFADVKPRKFDMASCVLINNLSELVVRQLEKDMAIRLKEKANKQLLDTFRNLQRAVDCYEHCVVLLDTSQEGWKVMYANAAWTKHTGLPREQLLGNSLSEVLEATDGTQLPSPALLKAVRDVKGAGVPLARVKDASVTKTFALTFRPAGRQVLDESTIPIGVPSFLALDGEDDVAHRFYFMTIAAPGERKVSSSSASQFGGMASLLSSYSSSSILESSIASSMLGGAANNNSMQGLELAHLLGRGSFGWVYYGLWYGTPVAVKVIDEDVRPSAKQQVPGSRRSGDSASVYSSAAGGGGGLVPHLEALMAHELRHPNIVATLKYGTTMVPCGRAPDLEDYAPGAGGAGHPRNSSSNAASGPQALPPASPLQPPTTPADASSVALAAAAHPSSISAPQNAMVPAEALASTGAASSAAMVTAQSGLAVSGSHANANGASSLLTSSAEEQLHSGSAAVASSAAAGGEGVAVPHGWVVIDAAAGAAAGELELDEEAEEDGEGGGKRAAEGAEGSAAMNVALQVRPDAWHHLAPAAAPGAQLLSSHASGTQLHSASSAAAGGKQLSAGANSQSTAAAAVASLQAKSPAAAAKAEASMMMKQTWMVMEFCDRGTVQDAIDRGWLRTERDCLRSEANWLGVVATAYDIASAMQYLHAHDVVHGDLTGWNVMLSSSGAGSTLGQRGFVAKVADFGLSRCMEMRTTIQTKTYGTLSHMPPELLAHGTISKAVDVYSFGVLLWQMYSGSRPWSGLTHAQIIFKVVQERQRLHWGADALPVYRQLAEACMAYDPQARPGFAAVVETLDALRSSLME